MNNLTSIFLGVIQGVTEFLPISSSGHLVLAQKLIPGFTQPGILFDVILHFGTTAAVLFYYRKKLLSLKFNYLVLLLVGTVPAVLAGLLFRKQIESMFTDTKFLGIQFIITAFLCFMVDSKAAAKGILNIKSSILIGIAQALAIIPAISRSGATIAAGVKLGIKKEDVAEYSFLMSVPAILGANILELYSHRNSLDLGQYGTYALGFLAALITGFLSIGVLLRLLKENKFKIFGYYSLVLGILVILIFRNY